MNDYDSILRAADDLAAHRRYKEAYNTLGQALCIGGPADWECRFRRGKFALQVARERLDELEESGQQGVALGKAACWLSRSEAYLMSASEQASGSELEAIQDHLATVRQEQERFRRLWLAIAR
ncbi:MAG: hypothetical protein ABR511_07045 [Acidimicrobiales bacterium]